MKDQFLIFSYLKQHFQKSYGKVNNNDMLVAHRKVNNNVMLELWRLNKVLKFDICKLWMELLELVDHLFYIVFFIFYFYKDKSTRKRC